MAVTLNALAQGFAADRVLATLRSHSIRHACVNTGEIGAMGRQEDGVPWTLGIQHPRRPAIPVGLGVRGKSVRRIDGGNLRIPTNSDRCSENSRTGFRGIRAVVGAQRRSGRRIGKVSELSQAFGGCFSTSGTVTFERCPARSAVPNGGSAATGRSLRASLAACGVAPGTPLGAARSGRRDQGGRAGISPQDQPGSAVRPPPALCAATRL